MVLLERRDAPMAQPASLVRGQRRSRWAPLWIGALVGVIAYAGAGVPSYWGDEAASVLSAQRPWPSLLSELSTVDAVHGLYYALLHIWVSVFGSSEWSTRALSAIGVGFLAAGVVVLGRRWFDRRTGVLAGLLVAVIPRAGIVAIEARGYALAAAAAVWLTILFVRVLHDDRRRGWVIYGVAVALSGMLFLYLLLMPLVHLTVLLTQRVAAGGAPGGRQVLRRWLLSLGLAGVLALPVLIAAARQKGQVSFLAHRGYMTPLGWFVKPWFGHPAAAAVLLPLLLIGLAAALGRRRHEGALPTIVWLLAPGIVLVLIDVLVSPTYNPRYLSFSLGAVALLLASGVWTIVDLAGRHTNTTRATIAVVTLVLVGGAVLVPQYVSERGPYAKDGGADGRAAAAVVAAEGQAGDTVLFGTGTRPSRAPRLVYRLYPEAFRGMADPQLITAAADTDGLWDRLSTVADVIPSLSGGTIWLIETGSTGTAHADLAALQAAGFVEVARTDVHRTVVYEFQKGAPS